MKSTPLSITTGLRQHLEPEVPRAAPALGRQEHHLLLPLPGQVRLQGLTEGAPAQGPPSQVPVRGAGRCQDWDKDWDWDLETGTWDLETDPTRTQDQYR